MIHVLTITYRKPEEEVRRTTAAHMEWLTRQYESGRVLLAGPQPDGAGGIIVTADLDDEQVRELVESDPWHKDGVAEYGVSAFTARVTAPGVVTTPPGAGPAVVLINVATTQRPADSVAVLSDLVRDLAVPAAGFRGSRLLTSVDDDAIVNLAQWDSEDEFQAMLRNPEFATWFRRFSETTTGEKFRLYRTSRIISPAS